MLTYLIAALVAAEGAAPLPAMPSLQAQFDTATAAHEAGRYDESIPAFEALELRPAVQRNPTAIGTIRLRKGSDLLARGRIDEAEKALRSGLNAIPRDNPELRADIYLAQLSLGRIEVMRFNYDRASANYRQALQFADQPGQRLGALLSLAAATTFDAGDAALQYADQAQAILESQSTRPDKKQLANFQTIRARILSTMAGPRKLIRCSKKQYPPRAASISG